MIWFIGGAIGTLIMGYLMDRVNPYWLIVLFFLVEAVALSALGQVPFTSGLFLGALIVWNFTQVGGQTGINNLATLSYPPEMRSSRDRLGRRLGSDRRDRYRAVRGRGGAAHGTAAVDDHDLDRRAGGLRLRCSLPMLGYVRAGVRAWPSAGLQLLRRSLPNRR